MNETIHFTICLDQFEPAYEVSTVFVERLNRYETQLFIGDDAVEDENTISLDPKAAKQQHDQMVTKHLKRPFKQL